MRTLIDSRFVPSWLWPGGPSGMAAGRCEPHGTIVSGAKVAVISCPAGGRCACESVALVHPQSLFDRDEFGRTVLFAAAEQGRQEEVSRIIFSLAGTGFAPQRLALIAIEDNEGLTAADVAEQGGHRAIADLLRSERARMEFFE